VKQVILPGNRALILPSIRDLFETGSQDAALSADTPSRIAEAIEEAKAVVRQKSQHQRSGLRSSPSLGASASAACAPEADASSRTSSSLQPTSEPENGQHHESTTQQLQSKESDDERVALSAFTRNHPQRKRRKAVNLDAQLALSSVRFIRAVGAAALL